ncbi:cytochrome c [Caenimonas sp. SL110]|uniref:c-type cytochrome n=1 Tax=Caenimonas sp. SL110 TaxID=1450524 RepID=UPI000652FE15|nr:cytochrome c [Caenimonas sp. SL110]
MKPWLKWTAAGVGALVLLLVLAIAAGLQLFERKKSRTVAVNVKAVPYATDAQSLARGKYLFESRGCVDCHGANGAGRDFVKTDSVQLRGSNITSAGVVGNYKPEDWVRIIRHGVKPNGQPAMVMPSEDYNRFTDQDLASLVAYARSLTPVTGGEAVIRLPLPARVMYGFGAIPDAAERINHTLPPAQPIPEAVNAKHGAYVANMCIGCHGEHLSGGKIAGGPPDWPAAANITPGEGSAMKNYKDSAQFVAMLRSGKRPDGTPIKVMPFDSLSKMNDVDAQALYEFLKTVPPRAAGNK